MTDTPIIDAAIRTACNGEMSERLPGCHYPVCLGACDVAATSLAVLRAALPWDLPAERLEAMARAMYERGPMFENTRLAWDAFPDYLADRRAVYIADALAAHQGDLIMRELYPEKD